jgi:hypothetical protein
MCDRDVRYAAEGKNARVGCAQSPSAAKLPTLRAAAATCLHCLLTCHVKGPKSGNAAIKMQRELRWLTRAKLYITIEPEMSTIQTSSAGDDVA